MNIEITWTANWVGNHEVCYREVGTSVFTCQTVAAVLGANSLVIDVPTNFCDDITYEGYVLAECSDPVDSNSDGFPDNAAQFQILIITQTDPCEPYQISCDTVAIESITIDNPGTGYVIGEDILANGVDIVGEITQVGGSGEIEEYTLFGGFLYSTTPTLTINTAAGINGALTAVLGTCLMSLNGCDGSNDNGAGETPNVIQVDVEVGDTVTICAETTPDPLIPVGTGTVTPGGLTGTCNCQDCVQIVVSNPTGSDLELSWTTCNDPEGERGETAIIFWTQTIVAGANNVVIPDCAILESIYAETGLVVVTNACPTTA